MKTLLLSLVCLLFSASSLFSQPEEEVLFVAHRGASYLAPENTLASIELAWELGAGAAECDIRLTSDERIVLFHDKRTRKLTGERYRVADTPWEVLRELKIKPGRENLPQYTGETIPLLEDVLATVPPGRTLVIEIKSGREILPPLYDVITGHWTSGSIAFIAFDLETILATKQLFPEVPCYFLASFRSAVNSNNETLTEGPLDGVNLRHRVIRQELVDRFHAAGKEVWCWTVNDPGDAREMIEMGVGAITTDRPGWLKEKVYPETSGN